MVAALDVQLIGFDVIGVALAQALLLFSGQPQRQRAYDLFRDRILNYEQVSDFSIKLVRPNRGPIAYSHQARGHAQTIAGLLNISVQDRINVQCPAGATNLFHAIVFAH